MAFDKIAAMISEQIDVPTEDITQDATLDDLGIDSLDLVDLIMSIEDDFGVEVTDEAALGFRTVGDIVDYLENT